MIVYIDGKDAAIIKAYFLEGSCFFMFPHCKVDFINGDKNVAVSLNRVKMTATIKE
jgi:hypothetical protein